MTTTIIEIPVSLGGVKIRDRLSASAQARMLSFRAEFFTMGDFTIAMGADTMIVEISSMALLPLDIISHIEMRLQAVVDNHIMPLPSPKTAWERLLEEDAFTDVE